MEQWSRIGMTAGGDELPPGGQVVIELKSTWGRVVVVAALLLAATAYLRAEINIWRASRWETSGSVDGWGRAAKLEPLNAAYWNQLGRAASLGFENAGLAAAESYFSRAVALDLHCAECWMNLAETREQQGDRAGAEEAFRSAQAASPVSAQVAWRYGNFLLRAEDFPAAAAEFRRALAADDGLSDNVVSEWQRAGRGADQLVSEVLPPLRDPYIAAMLFFLRDGRLDDALAVWNGLLRTRAFFPMRISFALIKPLADAGRALEAEHVWQQALAATGQPEEHAPGASLVFNGGFERDSLGGGFDWQLTPLDGASYQYDSAIFHTGARSLRIDFDGSANLDFHHLTELVPVEPARRYRFTAFFRARNLSSDRGIAWIITDPWHPGAVHAETPEVLGSTEWQSVSADFSTGRYAQMLSVDLRRIPSSHLYGKLSGSVWLDDIALVPLDPAAAPPVARPPRIPRTPPVQSGKR